MARQGLPTPIGLRIQQRRSELKMSPEEAAKAIGFDLNEWNLIEQGRKVLKVERVMQIAELLEMDPQELMDGTKSAGKWDFVDGKTGEVIGQAHYVREEHNRGGGIYKVQFPGKPGFAVETGPDKGLLDLGGYITRKVIETKIARMDNRPMKLYRDPNRNNRWYAFDDMANQYRDGSNGEWSRPNDKN